MPRITSSLVLLAMFAGTPATSESLGLDLRCTDTDQAITQKLRDYLSQDPEPDANQVNLVMARIASARVDCKRGRAERGLQTYITAETVLQALADSAAAKAMPMLETASDAPPLQ
jgi:hypothetical protein